MQNEEMIFCKTSARDGECNSFFLAQLKLANNSSTPRFAPPSRSVSALDLSFCPELQQCQHSCPCGTVSRPSQSLAQSSASE